MRSVLFSITLCGILSFWSPHNSFAGNWFLWFTAPSGITRWISFLEETTPTYLVFVCKQRANDNAFPPYIQIVRFCSEQIGTFKKTLVARVDGQMNIVNLDCGAQKTPPTLPEFISLEDIPVFPACAPTQPVELVERAQ